jgi:hypothetical protein
MVRRRLVAFAPVVVAASFVTAALPRSVYVVHHHDDDQHERGFDADYGTDFAVFLDNRPVNLPTHGHGQGYADVDFIIPETGIEANRRDHAKGRAHRALIATKSDVTRKPARRAPSGTAAGIHTAREFERARHHRARLGTAE